MKILKLILCVFVLTLTCNTFASDKDENLSPKHFIELDQDFEKLQEHLKHYDVNTEDSTGNKKTLFDYAVEDYLKSKSSTPDLSIIRFLISKGAKIHRYDFSLVLDSIDKNEHVEENFLLLELLLTHSKIALYHFANYFREIRTLLILRTNKSDLIKLKLSYDVFYLCDSFELLNDDTYEDYVEHLLISILLGITNNFFSEKELNDLSTNRLFRAFLMIHKYNAKILSLFVYMRSLNIVSDQFFIDNLDLYRPYFSELLELFADGGNRLLLDKIMWHTQDLLSEEDEVRLQIHSLIKNRDRQQMHCLDRAYILSAETLDMLLHIIMKHLYLYRLESEDYFILKIIIETLLNSGANPESLKDKYQIELYKIFPEWLHISTVRNLWLPSITTNSDNSNVSDDNEVDELADQTQASTSYLQSLYLFLTQWMSPEEESQGESSSSNEIEVVMTDEESKDDKGKEEETLDDKGKEEEKEEMKEDLTDLDPDYISEEEPFIHENYLQWLNFDEMQMLVSFIVIAHHQSR